LPRNCDFVVAMIAVLKLGCTVLALDPELPVERLRYQLKDSRASLILGDKQYAAEFDHDFAFCEIPIELNDNNTVSSDSYLSNSSSYIIYTSGSTGLPKGVVLSNRNIINRISWMLDELPFRSWDISCQKTSQTFVDFIGEVWGPLISGTTSVIIDKNDCIDLNIFLKICSKHHINSITAIPSFFESILDSGCNIKFNRTILSGERASLHLLYKLKNCLANTVFNLYGSSEVTADSLFFNFTDDYYIERTQDISVIGRAIANTVIYILDRDMNVVPVGVVGELYVGGSGVASGYVNKPDLTAERFVPNPFKSKRELNHKVSSRLYKTGDLGRHLPDGNIEFIGRLDDQIKIRGHRIELGEVECVLKSYKDTKEAVVVCKDEKLVAYITLHNDCFKEDEIKEYLAKYLPNYMLPSCYIKLDKLPLTSSGKIDRKALPQATFVSDEIYQAPRDGIEQELCQIWQDLLGISQVGINDNFFKLGGHSLLAIKLISRLRKKYGAEIKLISLFDNPTIKEFKQDLLEQTKQSVKDSSIIPYLYPRPTRAELSFAQQRLWFLDKLLPDAVIYNMPIALELRGTVDTIALRNTFEQIIQRHEILRTVFRESDDNSEAYQEILDNIDFYEEIDLSQKSDGTELAERYKLQEANWKFDLSTGPLCRVKVLILTKEHNILLITMHHIISDGWSLNILFEEMKQIYQNYVSGTNTPLPPLPIQYIDYSVWQRSFLTGERLERQLKYWIERLENVSEDIELPTDKPRPSRLSYKGGHHYFELDEMLCLQMYNICIQETVTPYMFFLTALSVLLFKVSGNNDILVGSPVAGRHIEETESLIGFFVNTLVTRSDVTSRKGFRQLLSEIRRETLQSYQHQDIPFEKLVDSLDITRAVNKNPLFQVRFVVIEDVSGGIELDDALEASFVPTPVEQAKFDLLFRFFLIKKNRIVVRIEYLKDLYDLSTIEKYGRYFESIVKSVVHNLDIKIRDIDILDIQEKDYQVIELNNTGMLL